MPNSVTIDEAVAVLNRALLEDYDAISKLFKHKEPCNKDLAEDPTIQVGPTDKDIIITFFNGMSTGFMLTVLVFGLLGAFKCL